MKILKGDPPGPPYWIQKWAVGVSNSTVSRYVKRGIPTLCQRSGQTSSRCIWDVVPRTYLETSTVILIVTSSLVLGFLVVWYSRGKTDNEEVFTSPARIDHSNVQEHSNVQLTRHFDDGPETISGQGVIIKQKPEDEDYPRDLRRRLRSSQNSEISAHSLTDSLWSSHNTSAETLVPPRKETRARSIVSLHDQSADEKHEGLIELDFNGKRKAFFKPSTGEFFHISRWMSTTSTRSDEDDFGNQKSFKHKTAEKNSTQRALGQMVAGGVSWAVGKTESEKMAERLQ